MPGEWKGMEKKFEEILIIRALRQDRIGQVMLNWIGFQLGPGFTDCDGSLRLRILSTTRSATLTSGNQ